MRKLLLIMAMIKLTGCDDSPRVNVEKCFIQNHCAAEDIDHKKCRDVAKQLVSKMPEKEVNELHQLYKLVGCDINPDTRTIVANAYVTKCQSQNLPPNLCKCIRVEMLKNANLKNDLFDKKKNLDKAATIVNTISSEALAYCRKNIISKKEEEQIQRKEREEAARQIKQAGICVEAVEEAARVFVGSLGQVQKILDIPQKVATTNDKGVRHTRCSVKVLTGGMWMPNMKWIMTYDVIENNGFFQVINSYPTGRAD